MSEICKDCSKVIDSGIIWDGKFICYECMTGEDEN